MCAEWEERLAEEALAAMRGEPQRSGMSGRPEDLSSAYSACRRVTLEHSRTFFSASALLPGPKRRAVRALYAFCRCTDDIVDAPRDDAATEMRRWRAAATCPEPPADQPVLRAWAHVRAEFGIPDALPERLIASVSRDLHQARYDTFDDLVDYCYGVASVVGLMSMKIIGFQSERAVPYAIRLGIAMQMTNILRDVAEDHARGRIYLPQDELARYGIAETQIAQGVVDVSWRRFMQFQIARARDLYADAWPGIPMLSPDGQFSIAAASELYAGILGQIERQDYDVFSRRAYVSRLARLSRLPGIYLRLLRARSNSAPHS